MPHIFTYGSLMFPEVFTRVVKKQYRCASAEVKHFKRTTMRHSSYPVVVADRRSPPLAGVLYFAVDARDLQRLDTFEGQYYQRLRTTAYVAEQADAIHAQLYVLRPAYRHLASWRPWCAQHFERQHLQRFCRDYCRT